MKPYLIEYAFFSLFLIGSTLQAARVALRRRRPTTDYDSAELVFHEQQVSAYSDTGLLGNFDSRQSLELVLTRSELWLRDMNASGQSTDQPLCNIVLNNIRSIRRQGKFIKIDFLAGNGLSAALLLRLRDRQGFLDQLNALVLPDGPLPFSLHLSPQATGETGSH